MTSVLFCVETEKEGKGFSCKLIVDGKIDKEWQVSKVSLENVGGKADIYEDIDRKIITISTDDYLNCEKTGDVLKCKGVTRRSAGWVERIHGR